MSATRWTTLLALAVVVAVLTWSGSWTLVRHDGKVPEVGWLVLPVELLIAAVVFVLGWSVRQYQRGRRPDLKPLRAVRTAVLAKAACYTGALLLGWYGGQGLYLVSDLVVPGNGRRAVAAGLAALGALVMAVVGLVVERFCRIPPPTDGAEVGAAP